MTSVIITVAVFVDVVIVQLRWLCLNVFIPSVLADTKLATWTGNEKAMHRICEE